MMEIASTHIMKPPSQPTSARHRCSASLRRSGGSKRVAPVVVRLETISK